MFRRSSLFLATLAAVVLLAPAAEQLSAQTTGYFGRNKVVYDSFDFKVLKTEHFDLYYYPEEAEAARMAARMAERWYARLSRLLNHEFRQRQPILLYADHTDFEQTNATPGQIDESTGGFTEILKRRVVLPLAGTLAESDHVLGHELVHAFQFDITGQGTGGVGPDIPGAIRLPLWFIEGMAEYLSIGPIDPFTTMWMRDALGIDEFPAITELGNRKYFPYRYGHAFWSYIAGNFGEDKIGRILNLAGRTGNPFGAIEAVLEVPIDELSERWRNEVTTYFAGIRDETQDPDAFGRRVIYEDQADGRLNLGPALSPDGSLLVYLSERDLFAIEMFLADAETGQILRRLTRNSVDPHFESLQWISSAGEFHPDGRRFVFAGVSGGKSVVSVMDVQTADITHEVEVERVGEIFTPSWSPDGRRVVFSALTGGFSDLWILDLETEQLTRLTDDPYADVQPDWSPDGRSIAFVTERFTTDLERIDHGPYQLALYDIETGTVERLPDFDDQKRNFNPQWSPDGNSLFFVSDHDGIANIYRLDVASSELFLVTNLYTGVSGLSALSPAISVASESGDLAFSANKGGPFSFEIYVMEEESKRMGVPAPEFLTQGDPSIIPPQSRVSTELSDLLGNPRLGLVDDITFEEGDYNPALSLDFVGQPTLAFGASELGVFFAGGASLYFSDLLGNRSLTTILQVNTSRGDFVKGTAAIVGYENRSSRWNWALLGGQLPLVTSRFGVVDQPIIDGNGNQRIIRTFQELRFFEIDREVTGILSYPFNRSQRLELAASARNIDFAGELRELGVDLQTGGVVLNQETDIPDCSDLDMVNQLCAPGSLGLGSVSAALVYDTSIFGGTSPILGQRYRIELEPTVGSVNYLSILGDFRKYMRFAPFTLAGRGVHFGRYGGDADDTRLSQLFLGYQTLVRGYDDNSFEVQECTNPIGSTASSCPEFERLLGSRIAVANVELRLPLLGAIGLIPSPGVPPIAIGGFFDAGIAWSGAEGQGLGDRDVIKSAGGFARLNLFGFAIVELSAAHPFDRPGRDLIWQLGFVPGF